MFPPLGDNVYHMKVEYSPISVAPDFSGAAGDTLVLPLEYTDLPYYYALAKILAMKNDSRAGENAQLYSASLREIKERQFPRFMMKPYIRPGSFVRG